MTLPPNIPWLASGYAFYSSTDQRFGGFVRFFGEAQKMCQEEADGVLGWVERDPGLWEAKDSGTGTIYEINEIEH